MLLRDVCTLEVICTGPHTSALEAARLMRHRHVGDVVIVAEEGERAPLGIVTDRDLVVEVLAKGHDPATTTLASVMRTPVVIAKDSEDTSEVIERMRMHGVRRIPVVSDRGAVTGIVTFDDLLRRFVTDAGSLLGVISAGQNREQRTR